MYYDCLVGGGGPGGWDLLGWDWILSFIFTSSRNVCQAQTIIDKIKGGGHKNFHHQYPPFPKQQFFFYIFDFTSVGRIIILDHGIPI